MTMSTPEGPDDGLDVNSAWERIVAGWDEEAPGHDGSSSAPVVEPAPAPPATPVAEEPEEFVPPVPPPLSRSLSARAALTWLLICGPPVVLLMAGFAGWAISRFRVGLAALTFTGGCALLVLQLRNADDDPPADDGAVV